MANTLTGLIPTVYKAADTVMREQVGFIPSVYIDPSAEGVAKDQTLEYPVVGSYTASDVTPASTLPNPSGVTVGYGTMSINKVRSVQIPWNGEEQASLGGTYENVIKDQFAQAMRTLVNEIEADLFTAAKQGASRAYGTAGTTPFATAGNLTDIAQVRKILSDNGAWTSDMQFVMSSAAAANIRGVQSSLFKVNEAGDARLLREGFLGNLQGFQLHESGQISAHTIGTGSGYLLNLTAGYAAGSTSFAVDTGSGTILAGDILTNTKTSRDTNKYVVGSTLAANAVGLNKPGNKVAWVNNDPVAVGASYTGNFAFQRNAIHLLTRLPKMPLGGDAAKDVQVITDPFSGISFQLALYGEYRQTVVEVAVAWGVKAVKSEAIATLLG